MKNILDELWCEIEKLIPEKQTAIGRPEFDRRRTINGIIYTLHMGAQYQWKVEQTFGILSWHRGLNTYWAKTRESALSFLQITCSLRFFKMAGIFG